MQYKKLSLKSDDHISILLNRWKPSVDVVNINQKARRNSIVFTQKSEFSPQRPSMKQIPSPPKYSNKNEASTKQITSKSCRQLSKELFEGNQVVKDVQLYKMIQPQIQFNKTPNSQYIKRNPTSDRVRGEILSETNSRKSQITVNCSPDSPLRERYYTGKLLQGVMSKPQIFAALMKSKFSPMKKGSFSKLITKS